jgi:hypothetical protein
VRVGDDEALAEGIIRALALPANRERLRERAQIFSVHTAVDRYLKVLLGGRDAAEASRNQHVQIGY